MASEESLPKIQAIETSAEVGEEYLEDVGKRVTRGIGATLPKEDEPVWCLGKT